MKRLLSLRTCINTVNSQLLQTPPSRQISRNIPLYNLSLYSDDTLGVTGYVETRRSVQDRYGDKKDVFRNKMTEFVKDGPTNMIFTEDLKTMVYLSEGEKDFELLHNMMVKFNSQNKDIRFGNFIFGPVAMRMYSHYNAYDEALQVFRDEKLAGFFDQIASYHVLCNLLYRNEKYDDLIEVFEYVRSKQIQMSKYPKHIVLLLFAACYKQNTPESLKYASKVWSDIADFGITPIRKAVAFFASLALNQGNPHISLEAISSLKQQSYVTVRNIKLLAYADLNRPDLAIPVLRALLDTDIIGTVRHTVFKYGLEKLQNVVEKTDDLELRRDFSQIVKGLQERNMIEDKTMDDYLNQEIILMKPNETVDNQLLANSFRNNRRIPIRFAQHGIKDMN